MAGTTVPADMTVEQWDDQYFEDFVNKDWWKKFSGSGADTMICVKEDLVDKPGNKVHVALVNELESEPLGENDLFEGNEKSIKLRDQAIEVHEYGLPLKFKHFEQKKTAISLRQAHKSSLETWNTKLHRDKVLHALTGFYDSAGLSYRFNPTTGLVAQLGPGNPAWQASGASETVKDFWLSKNGDRALFGAALGNTVAGDMSASLANVDSTNDKFTPDALDLMKYMAEHPAAGKPKVRPMTPRGKIAESHGFVAFVDDLILRDIRANTAFQQANREARQRGTDNPIFMGANYIWNNVAIYSIPELTPLKSVGASSIDVGRVMLCGAQAVGVAWGKRPWTVDKKIDFDRFSGLAIMQWYEVDKLRWGTGATDKDDPVDHGIIHGFFSATAYA